MTLALIRGGREHFGWGTDRYLQAEIYDAVNQNTRACGNWTKKGPPKIPAFPRPTPKETAPKKKVTVKDLYQHFVAGKG